MGMAPKYLHCAARWRLLIRERKYTLKELAEAEGAPYICVWNVVYGMQKHYAVAIDGQKPVGREEDIKRVNRTLNPRKDLPAGGYVCDRGRKLSVEDVKALRRGEDVRTDVSARTRRNAREGFTYKWIKN